MVFAQRAKLKVLSIREAQQTAADTGVQLMGLTRTSGGIIGALAGLGLRRAGEDGRFLWLPSLRELSGVYPVTQLALLLILIGSVH
jgi:hypothetical protein